MSKSTGDRLKHITIKGKRLNELPQLPILDTTEMQGDLKDLPKVNYEKLVKTHLKHGIFLPFYVWESPEGINYIADGHQRRRVLPNEGYTGNVPVVYIEARNMQEAKEKLLVISSQYGKITQEGYDEFTFDLPDIGEIVNFDALSFEFGQDEDEEPEQGDAEPQTDRAAELQEQWGTELGQLWAIGEHRLLCGDSTVRADVERVMGGERADCITTDPPYGVDYDGGTKEREKLEGDDSPALYFPALSAWKPFCNNHAALYLWYADGDQAVAQAVAQAGWQTRRNLIWNKNQAQYGALSQQYKQKHEPFLYCHIKGQSPYWAGDGTEVTVWDMDRHSINEFHPTQKPPALFERAIKNSSKAKDVVFDGFAGSGTTLVACQNLSRRGRAIEISPAYCAVILQRMTDAFPGIDIYKVE